MTRNPFSMRALVATGVAGGVVVAAAALSAPAAADTVNYLKSIREQGVSTPGGDPELKEWGWEVCALAAKGLPYEKIRAQAVYNSGSKPQYGMSVEQADAIVQSAMTNLCNDKR